MQRSSEKRCILSDNVRLLYRLTCAWCIQVYQRNKQGCKHLPANFNDSSPMMRHVSLLHGFCAPSRYYQMQRLIGGFLIASRVRSVQHLRSQPYELRATVSELLIETSCSLSLSQQQQQQQQGSRSSGTTTPHTTPLRRCVCAWIQVHFAARWPHWTSSAELSWNDDVDLININHQG